MRCQLHTRYPGGSILTPVWYTRRFPTLKIRATPAQRSIAENKQHVYPAALPSKSVYNDTATEKQARLHHPTTNKVQLISNSSSSTSSRRYKIATRGAAQVFPFLKTPQPRPCLRPLYFLLERRVRMGCMRRACSDNPLLRACIEQAKRATEQTRAKHRVRARNTYVAQGWGRTLQVASSVLQPNPLPPFQNERQAAVPSRLKHVYKCRGIFYKTTSLFLSAFSRLFPKKTPRRSLPLLREPSRSPNNRHYCWRFLYQRQRTRPLTLRLISLPALMLYCSIKQTRPVREDLAMINHLNTHTRTSCLLCARSVGLPPRRRNRRFRTPPSITDQVAGAFSSICFQTYKLGSFSPAANRQRACISPLSSGRRPSRR